MACGGCWIAAAAKPLPPALADGLDGRGRARDGSRPASGAHPERGRPGCGQPEGDSARPGQQPGMAAKNSNATTTVTVCVSRKYAGPLEHRTSLTGQKVSSSKWILCKVAIL